MKKLFAVLAVMPGAALAHGGHAPMPAGAHELSHAAPVVGGVIIVAALALGLMQRWRS